MGCAVQKGGAIVHDNGYPPIRRDIDFFTGVPKYVPNNFTLDRETKLKNNILVKPGVTHLKGTCQGDKSEYRIRPSMLAEPGGKGEC
jgi:hypothetical protein